jgi:hypothetical protein
MQARKGRVRAQGVAPRAFWSFVRHSGCVRLGPAASMAATSAARLLHAAVNLC